MGVAAGGGWSGAFFVFSFGPFIGCLVRGKIMHPRYSLTPSLLVGVVAYTLLLFFLPTPTPSTSHHYFLSSTPFSLYIPNQHYYFNS